MRTAVSELLWAEAEQRPGYELVRLRGSLSLVTVPRARLILEKNLAEHGRVVVDLAGLALLWRPAVEVFPTALASAGGWPLARMVLTGAGPDLAGALLLLRVTRTVPVVEDPVEAAARLVRRPDRIFRARDLPAHPAAPGAARAMVHEVCDEWDVAAVDEGAALIVTELVTNALVHARTSCRVTLTVDERGLRVGVRDYRVGPHPRPRPVDVTGEGGRGLHLVAMIAGTWEVRDHPDGKTVWALLPLPPPDGDPLVYH